MFLFLTRLALAADVYVSSNVNGAQILVNGVETGILTPGTVSGVAPGVVTLTVVRDCVRGEVTTAVTSGVTKSVSVTAVSQLGTITVRSNPSQAKLSLDDRPWPGVAGAPVAVECGTHTISAEQTGYIPAVVTVDLHMDEDIDLPLNLSKLGMGTLDLTGQPRTATITLDGRPIGEDAVSLPSVFAGVHAIGANLDGYKTATKQIVVADGDAQAWHIELARESSKKDSVVTVIRPGRGGELAEGLDGGTEEERAAATEAEVRAAHGAAARTAAADAARQRRAEDVRRRGARTEAPSAEAEAVSGIEAAEVAQAQAEKDAEAADRAAAAQAAAQEAEREQRALEARRKAAIAAKADIEAAEQPASPRTTTTPVAVKKPSSTSMRIAPTKIAGVTSMALGAGAGGLGAYFYVQTSRAYTIYDAKVKSARSQQDQQLASGAQTYFDNTVVPRRNAMYASGGVCGALLVTGVVLVLVDEVGPVVAPLPGGGMLGWTGRF